MDRRRPERKTASLATVRHAFKTIIWPRKKLVFLGLILIIINRLAGLVLPGSSKYIIDNAIKDQDLALLKLILAVVAVAVVLVPPFIRQVRAAVLQVKAPSPAGESW